jgi:heat shock protein HtpX
MVDELAARAGVPTPRLYLIPSEQPNAFATGRNPSHAAVAVTEGLLAQLPAEQLRGVLAHEFAHIRNRDILVSTIAAMVAGAISAIANLLQLSFLFGGADEEDSPLGAQLLGDGAPLADALASLERGTQLAPMRVNPATASLYIANPLPRTGLATLFMTHPPTAERIRRLRALELRAPVLAVAEVAR